MTKKIEHNRKGKDLTHEEEGKTYETEDVISYDSSKGYWHTRVYDGNEIRFEESA